MRARPSSSSFGRNDVIVVVIGTVAYVAILWLHDSIIGVAAV